MSDEITRKYLQSIKRCLSFAQTRWPPTDQLQLMGWKRQCVGTLLVIKFSITLAQWRREGILGTGQLSRNDGHVRALNVLHRFPSGKRDASNIINMARLENGSDVRTTVSQVFLLCDQYWQSSGYVTKHSKQTHSSSTQRSSRRDFIRKIRFHVSSNGFLKQLQCRLWFHQLHQCWCSPEFRSCQSW